MSAPGARPPVRRLAARLAHDVGKYVARTAHNVGEADCEADWTPALASMLARDLYALPGGRASAVFATSAQPIAAAIGPQSELANARDLLAQIDALEGAVRQGERPALARAARLALDVERILREFVRRLPEDTP
jgi:hypothetical protein